MDNVILTAFPSLKKSTEVPIWSFHVGRVKGGHQVLIELTLLYVGSVTASIETVNYSTHMHSWGEHLCTSARCMFFLDTDGCNLIYPYATSWNTLINLMHKHGITWRATWLTANGKKFQYLAHLRKVDEVSMCHPVARSRLNEGTNSNGAVYRVAVGWHKKRVKRK